MRHFFANILSSAVLLCGCAIGCKPQEKPKLIVGTEATFAPYEYYNGEKISGIDPDIAAEIARQTGRTLEFEDIGFSYLLPAVQSGKIDMAASALTITEERKKVVDFSDPYAESGLVIVIPLRSAIRTPADLKGRIIGVQQGTTADEYITTKIGVPARFPNAEIAVQNLLAGKIDALVEDRGPAALLVRRHKELLMLPTPLTEERYAFAVRKGNTKLLQKINAVIRQLKESGELSHIRMRHETLAVQRKKAGETEKKKIRAAIDPTFPPIGYLNNGTPDGIEIELLKLIARELDMEISFEQVGFDSLLEAVVHDNGVDLGAGSISITPERRKLVEFTLPYFDARQYLFVRRDSAVTSLQDLKGKRVGAIYCTTAESFLREKLGDPEKYSEGELLFKALSEGEIDGAVMDESPAEIFMRRYRNLKRLPIPLLKEQYGFVVRRENRELREKIDGVLMKFRADGTLHKITEKHFQAFRK